MVCSVTALWISFFVSFYFQVVESVGTAIPALINSVTSRGGAPARSGQTADNPQAANGTANVASEDVITMCVQIFHHAISSKMKTWRSILSNSCFISCELWPMNRIKTRQSSYGKSQEAYHPRRNLSKFDLSQCGFTPVLARGVPQFCPGQGVTPVLGYLPGTDQGPVTGVPPWKDHGANGSIMGWRWGKPPPHVEQTDTYENITSLRTTYAVDNYSDSVLIWRS